MAHGVVHEVVAERSAGVRQALGEVGGGGVQQDAGRLERRSREEDDTGRELERLARLPIDHVHGRHAAVPVGQVCGSGLEQRSDMVVVESVA